MTVWILMRGEANEGGDILGVFATRDAATRTLAEAARRLHWGVEDATQAATAALPTTATPCNSAEPGGQS